MNYCILNGKKSTDVKNLIIQKLPPISKPLKRTQIEQIDGRDGDIVTDLGYSAYDKTMSIGIYGDYDVDEVIDFFDSKGEVIFSNEPDKYYKYEIINQIDLAKLLRFRTADVVFHVQPYKYSAVDRLFIADKEQLTIPSYSRTANNKTVTAINNHISITGGNVSSQCEFYIPVDVDLVAGGYRLNAITTNGVGENKIHVKLIESLPIASQSFANELVLENGTVGVSRTLSSNKHYGYIWILVESGQAYANITLNLLAVNLNSISLFNRGNRQSKPKITVYGTSDISLLINGTSVLSLNLDNAPYVVIDPEEMNAYYENIFFNRYVVGDYDNVRLDVGANVLSWTGNVNKVIVENFSRWI